jgi:hypothetical protein
MTASLEAWSSARSKMILTADALAEGRLKAAAVWNGYPTDADSADAVKMPTAAISMLEDAAYAFAFLNESLRIDSQKMLIKGSGVEGDPSRTLSSMTALALRALDDYAKWVAETKPVMAASSIGL